MGKQFISLMAMGLIMIAVVMIFALAINLIVAWPFMWVWNASAVVAFGLKPIGYWTSFWLLYLMAFFAASMNMKVSANKSD